MKFLLSLTGTFLIILRLSAQNISFVKAKEFAVNGNLKQAIKFIDKAINEDSFMANYYCYKADYLVKLANINEAIETLSQGIDRMPDSVSLFDFRGTLFENSKQFNLAIKDFTTAYAIAKSYEMKSHLLANRGGAKYRIRDFKGSYSDLQTAVELDPNNIDALNNLAAVCDHVGKSKEAQNYLEQITSIDPSYVPAYINLGFKYQEQNNHHEAIKFLNKALAINPNEGLAYSNRSFSKLKINDLEGAMQDINQSLKLLPNNAYAYKIRALIFIEQKNIKKACNDLNQAKQLGYTVQFGDEVDNLSRMHCIRNN